MDSIIREEDLDLHELVSYGAGGEVYRAIWRSPNGELQVAAKKIPIRGDTDIDEQMHLEVDILKNLHHKNVIKYYGQVMTSTHLIIVTEFASKGSLKDCLKKKKKLPPLLVKKWAIEAARGIQYLQRAKIVHRDIKSPNFLVTADDTLKICDFGIAKQQDSTKTTQNPDKGTQAWLAPEVFMDGKLSPKADIFALGIVLWELSSCEVPYKGMIQQHVMFKVSQGLRPEIPDDCPFELKQLMQECWSQDRKKRPGIDEVVSRLERFGGSEVERHLEDGGGSGQLAQDIDVEPNSGTAEAPAPVNHDQLVINSLTPDQLRHLYPELGLNHVVIEKAIANSGTRDVGLQAEQVFRVWRDKRKQEATTEAMIAALQKCRFNETAQRLQAEVCGAGGGFQGHGGAEPMEVATGFPVQNTEAPVAGAGLTHAQVAAIPAPHQAVRNPAARVPPQGAVVNTPPQDDAWNTIAGLNLTTMQKRDLNRRILHASTEMLCNYLLPDSMLPKLKSREVLNDSEVGDIRGRARAEPMVDRLLEILKRKSDRSFGVFMALLKETDPDLYQEVKRIECRVIKEWRNSYVANQAPVMQPQQRDPYRPYQDITAISDRDFHDVMAQLRPSELQKLYLRLGLRRVEVEKAERRANSTDEELKAMEVFQLWRQMNGRKATREAILDALRSCENQEVWGGLQRQWNLY